MITTILLIFSIALIAGALFFIFNLNKKSEQKQQEFNALLSKASALESSLQHIEKNAREFQTKNEHLTSDLEKKQSEITFLKQKEAELNANYSALLEKLKTQKEEIDSLQKKAQLEFEQIANKIFEDKSSKFTQSNKENIETILKPLNESINHFKKRVEDTFTEETKQRTSLATQVKELVEQTNKVSTEANNLASALKGQTKKMGNWGELILENILQQSGLEKNREYEVQSSFTNEDDRRLQPDVIIKLPDNRIVIIDSKVSLVAYDRFHAAETKEEQELAVKEHLRSIKNHIDGLSSKKYDDLTNSLDFTMMFVPIEPAYLLAMQNEPELWSYAYSKRIILISPTNLIACLKLIADLWKRELQSKNAQEIVRRGEMMYEKFVNFTATLEDLGKQINRTQSSYENALNQFCNGRGNLINQAQTLKKLGLKSEKTIPSALINDEDLDLSNSGLIEE